MHTFKDIWPSEIRVEQKSELDQDIKVNINFNIPSLDHPACVLARKHARASSTHWPDDPLTPLILDFQVAASILELAGALMAIESVTQKPFPWPNEPQGMQSAAVALVQSLRQAERDQWALNRQQIPITPRERKLPLFGDLRAKDTLDFGLAGFRGQPTENTRKQWKEWRDKHGIIYTGQRFLRPKKRDTYTRPADWRDI